MGNIISLPTLHSERSEALERYLIELLQAVRSGEITGVAVGMTKNGRPAGEALVGEVAEDCNLALAVSCRLQHRIATNL